MPSNNRSDNQYFGKYFENAICCAINNVDFFNPTDFNFTQEELNELNNEAILVAKYINSSKAEWVGNQTSNADCDIITEKEHLEIKRVSQGTGTYFNTSIYYFTKFGFNFKAYMKKYGLYDAIKKLGYSPNENNNSPVDRETSSKIRHLHKDEYEKYIIPCDNLVRKNFQNDIINYFNNNIEKAIEFLQDMLSKNSLTNHKGTPDRIIVFNYKSNKIFEINVKNLKNNVEQLTSTEKGIKINNIRFALSWQNGAGLNNPTIRVFI